MEKQIYLPPNSITYYTYAEKLFKDIPKKYIIRTITFQVTEDCCMACTYCF